MSDPNSSMEDILKVTTSKIRTLDEIPFMEQIGYLAIAAILAVFSEEPTKQNKPIIQKED